MLSIVIQRPQWKKQPVKSDAATHRDQDPANLFDENSDDIYVYQDTDIPNIGHHDAGTTASEFDGAPDASEDEDEAVKAMDVDEPDDSEEPNHPKNTKKVCN